MRGKRVLITGGLGFIGSNLAVRCLELGAAVTVFDNLDPRCAGNKHNLAEFEDSMRLIMQDLRDRDSVKAAVSAQDVVFNCAAHTSHGNSLKDPFYDLEVNGTGLLTLLEAVRLYNPAVKFVHVGTSTQVGRMQETPVTEAHPEFPTDIYSASKTLGEKYALIYGNAHGLRTTVIRLANVYGPRAHIRTPQFGFVNYFIGLALQQKELTVYGDGSQLRNLSFVEDCAAALIRAAVSEKSEGEVFFATADQQYSVKDIAERIAATIGGRVRFVDWPEGQKTIDVGDAIISNRKIKTMLDWRPVWSLNDGLARTSQFFHAHPAQYL